MAEGYGCRPYRGSPKYHPWSGAGDPSNHWRLPPLGRQGGSSSLRIGILAKISQSALFHERSMAEEVWGDIANGTMALASLMYCSAAPCRWCSWYKSWPRPPVGQIRMVGGQGVGDGVLIKAGVIRHRFLPGQEVAASSSAWLPGQVLRDIPQPSGRRAQPSGGAAVKILSACGTDHRSLMAVKRRSGSHSPNHNGDAGRGVVATRSPGGFADDISLAGFCPSGSSG